MSDLVYYFICAALTLGVLAGIAMMSKVRRAVIGNALSAVCTTAAVLVTLYKYEILGDIALWVCLAAGTVAGLVGAYRVQMISMPQAVALLNGLGGGASAIVGGMSLLAGGQSAFARATAGLAILVGGVTLTGSLIAAGKLQRLLPQKSIIWPMHQAITFGSLLLALAANVALVFVSEGSALYALGLACLLFAFLFGCAFSVRVGGADMPVTISLLNSFSGVAGAIAGMAIADPLLVAIGGVVGASGLLLTQIMCRSMNRSLLDILLGKTSVASAPTAAVPPTQASSGEVLQKAPIVPANSAESAAAILASAQNVILIPGYGMALAQAQGLVKQLSDTLEAVGITVNYAIHPVAGRMPGHMNVLLAEVDVPYEKLLEMDEVNPLFASCDAAVIIGANDVVNPAANTAEGTPIYGMPILEAGGATNVIVCNYDDKPGYAGVDNPLYTDSNTIMVLGDAKDTLTNMLSCLKKGVSPESTKTQGQQTDTLTQASKVLENAENVILIPGYGMALAQAQGLVKQLCETLEKNGKQVDFAIHPVAGRMPGHMNVLLAEVDVPYEKLLEMDEVNPRFSECDAAIIIGANDVVNPAANTAEGTPIYGMPILEAALAKNIIVCNYDTRPGYAGVDNPLYTASHVSMLVGDAKESIAQLLNTFD